ncbi:hypothetical protein JMA_02680 [Jeotgalibacillus malaysiensis]|uniref:Activator of Hsp90 ATPase homologue 1/2-like C-terminal domain-containing protein n=1 Tax=Jeotgalibacillus malaysiensis TaxID=1508404 RepID=A0A0B5AGU5_9BACL|nr:SRPBCC domain-containing protein [Jeotgalibacillus malaysiensis]AJD89585.1 hypothetical protein JMA_02680 [Jeotgalibacillus malaysiensis]
MENTSFSISINTSREQVWNTLWHDKTFQDWASIIDEGTYKKGDLKEGSEMEFISSVNGYGVTSKVETLRPQEYVLFRHRADTQDSGQQARDDEWTGGSESYTLTEQGDGTLLVLTMDIPREQEETFAERVPKALERIKWLSENA